MPVVGFSNMFGLMTIESVVETNPSILEITPPFGAQPVVPEVFTVHLIETDDVGPSIRHNVSFDVMLGFVSCIFYDVPTISYMDMSYFEYSPMCYDCVCDSSLSLSQQPSTSHIFNIDDEP